MEEQEKKSKDSKKEKHRCKDCYYYGNGACLNGASPKAEKIVIFSKACEMFK